MRMHGSVWTDDDLKRLAAIVTAGGTPLRTSAALRRIIAACRNQAKKIWHAIHAYADHAQKHKGQVR